MNIKVLKEARRETEEDNEFESDMVTLERIDLQKKFLRRSYTVKSKRALAAGREPFTLALRNCSFGIKGRYQALIALLQGEMNEKIKHFSIEGSTIQSKKLVSILQELTMNDNRTL